MKQGRAAAGALVFFLAGGASVYFLRARPAPAPAETAFTFGGALASVYTGRFREAVRRFSELIRRDSRDPRAYYFRGLAYRELRALPEAVADLTRAVELDPSLSGARYLRALSRRELGDIPGALADVDVLLAAANARPDMRVLRADLLQELGREREARDDLDRALAEKPGSYFALVRRGRLNSRLTGILKGVEDYDAAIALEPRLAAAYIAKAEGLRQLRRHDDAAKAARLALERLPGRADIYLLESRIESDRYRYDQALAAATAAIGISPKNHEPWVKRAIIYRSSGVSRDDPSKFALALLDHDKSVELAPKSPEVYLLRSNTDVWADHLDKALDDAKAALALDPRSASAQNAICDVYRMRREYDKALPACDKSIDIDPYSASLRITRALTLEALNRTRDALKDCDQAVKFAPESVEVWFHRGHIRLRAGRRDDAMADLRKALLLDPGDKRVQRAMEEAVSAVRF
jgi:tetratricopeptide (TPR) repeat protein